MIGKSAQVGYRVRMRRSVCVKVVIYWLNAYKKVYKGKRLRREQERGIIRRLESVSRMDATDGGIEGNRWM